MAIVIVGAGVYAAVVLEACNYGAAPAWAMCAALAAVATACVRGAKAVGLLAATLTFMELSTATWMWTTAVEDKLPVGVGCGCLAFLVTCVLAGITGGVEQQYYTACVCPTAAAARMMEYFLKQVGRGLMWVLIWGVMTATLGKAKTVVCKRAGFFLCKRRCCVWRQLHCRSRINGHCCLRHRVLRATRHGTCTRRCKTQTFHR